MSMNYGPTRGMRDFYPDAYRMREHVFQAWRKAALMHGFEFVDAPIVESLELLERKAGEEISDQLYAFEDKKGRAISLRGEFTPSMARMILNKRELLNSVQKWTTIAQCFRYERMSRGRKREHYQWNMDIIGADSIVADFEVMSTAIDAMRSLGLDSENFVVKIGSRSLLNEIYTKLDLPQKAYREWCRVLDRKGKVPASELETMYSDLGLTANGVNTSMQILEISTLEEAARFAPENSKAIADLKQLFQFGADSGLDAFMEFSPSIVRGLDYYTGIVFEGFDRLGEMRSIFGGGRYDNLLKSLGGPDVPCVGLGMGDVVLGEMLEDLNLATSDSQRTQATVGYMTLEAQELALETARQLRNKGYQTDLSLKVEAPGAFFGRSSAMNVEFAAYVGESEVESRAVFVKIMKTGDSVPVESIEPK